MNSKKTTKIPVAYKKLDLNEMGRRVTSRRKELGRSQEWLAEQADLSKTTIYSIENGIKSTKLKNLFLLAQALETTPDQLMAFDKIISANKEHMTRRERIDVMLDGCDTHQLESIEKLLFIYTEDTRKK